MSNCLHYQELIEKIMAGESLAHEKDDLDQHCESCSSCSELLQMHQDLTAMGTEIPSPDRLGFRDMREAVLAATSVPKPGTEKNGFLQDIRQLWMVHPLPTGFAAAALLACFVFVAQLGPQSQSPTNDWLQPMVQQVALEQNSLESFWDSQFSFSNVSVRPREDGQLALSFDASRHIDMEVNQSSPLAREVLLHAIMDPSSMGSRLQAMEAVPKIRDSRLKDALIYTMLNDVDPTVRLNAITVLQNYPHDQKDQDALLQILSQDPDVQMRLTAMNELVLRDVGIETIRETVEQNNRPGDMAILRTAALDL